MEFDALEPADFEEFCFSLLAELGFVNIDWRRGSPKGGGASDSGRDIEAELDHTDIDGERRVEKWFIDCKHYEKAVPPDALQGLLTWATATRPQTALFIVSGFLSNPAKDYLREYEESNRPPFRIKYWERPQLERLAGDKGDLLARYLLMNLRQEGEVLEAEAEFFDRVWLDRHEMIMARSGGIADEKLRATAEKAAEEVRERLGVDNVGPYDDFEWGMINGKLSALRWVLGDEWDMLDT